MKTCLSRVPRLLHWKASTPGIYYEGVRRWGDAFARDLGKVFEAYVGRLLRLFPSARVEPEVLYGRNRDQKSVDWFVITDECVMLVEAKSTRPTEAVRTGGPGAVDDLKRMFGKAIGQLNKSAGLVRSGALAFAHIPNDRPLVGIVATLENFHVVNSPFTAGWLPECDIPWRVCAASELEDLSSVADVSPSRLYLDAVTDAARPGHSLSSALPGHTRGPNSVIDEAWDTLPWKERREDTIYT